MPLLWDPTDPEFISVTAFVKFCCIVCVHPFSLADCEVFEGKTSALLISPNFIRSIQVMLTECVLSEWIIEISFERDISKHNQGGNWLCALGISLNYHLSVRLGAIYSYVKSDLDISGEGGDSKGQVIFM